MLPLLDHTGQVDLGYGSACLHIVEPSISIPLYDPTVKKASELATKIGANCTVVTKWDAVNQGYIPYIATLGIYEFDTVGGQGYFVSVTDATDVTFSGTPWSD